MPAKGEAAKASREQSGTAGGSSAPHKAKGPLEHLRSGGSGTSQGASHLSRSSWGADTGSQGSGPRSLDYHGQREGGGAASNSSQVGSLWRAGEAKGGCQPASVVSFDSPLCAAVLHGLLITTAPPPPVAGRAKLARGDRRPERGPLLAKAVQAVHQVGVRGRAWQPATQTGCHAGGVRVPSTHGVPVA